MPEGITVREFNGRKDAIPVEDLERRCQVRTSSSSLVVDTMGDPVARVRNSPLYTMLVAELDNHELVGVIRGSIKTVVVCSHSPTHLAKVGCVLGLRVSPAHRRKGIGYKLVTCLEDWFRSNDAEYAYMATEKDNHASVKLFTEKCCYSKFRSPSILVNPVNFHPKTIPSSVKIIKLSINQAEFLYRKHMGSIEFFPADIDRILANKLSLGTWLAHHRADKNWDRIDEPPESWAMLSVWNSSALFKLKVEGSPILGCASYARFCGVLDKTFPCLRFPAFPDVFSSFGFYFMYGLHHHGRRSAGLMAALCRHVNNMAAVIEDCRVIVTEVGGRDDQLKSHIPHWKSLSCSEDLWCIKSFVSGHRPCCAKEGMVEWSKSPSPNTLFVDPREV